MVLDPPPSDYYSYIITDSIEANRRGVPLPSVLEVFTYPPLRSFCRCI